MYFPDLSDYIYMPRFARPGLVNIGWLEREYQFERGVVPTFTLETLVELVTNHRTAITRGLHYCPFCAPSATSPLFHEREAWQFTRWGAGEMLLGNGEIRVPGKSGKSYAAPTMILHYCRDHFYRPPQEFLDGVDRYTPKPHSDPVWCEQCTYQLRPTPN